MRGVESSPIRPGGGKRARRAGTLAVGLVTAVALASCSHGDNGKPNPAESPFPSLSVTAIPGESKGPNPFASLFPSQTSTEKQQQASGSVCDTQSGIVTGELPGDYPKLSATITRPSIFIVSPDVSGTQAFSVHSASDPNKPWDDIALGSSEGIVGIATADTIFAATKGRGVLAKTCIPAADAVQEVQKDANDLCKNSKFGFKEVVVYEVGANGNSTPQVLEKVSC